VNRRLGAIVFALLASGPAWSQDAVRLRSGRELSGDIVIDSKDPDSFSIRIWDTGALLRILWTQIPDSEKDRLLQRQPEPSPGEAMVDGVVLLTAAREVIGVVARDEPALLHVKVATSPRPTPVPKVAILKRIDLRIRESEAYTEDEMIERRAKAAGPQDAAALIAVGKFAAGLRLYERARDFYVKAAGVEPARQPEVASLLAENDRLMLEAKAADLIAEVRRLLDELDHPKALDLAKRFLTEYAATALAKANASLVEQVEKEAKEFAIHRAEVLAAKVPNLWRAKRTELIARAAQLPLAEARQRMTKIDEEIGKDLTQRLKAALTEIEVAWEKRDAKPRVAHYGSGTWIARGGQNGGFDFQAPPPDPALQQQNPDQILIPIQGPDGRVLYYVSAGASGGGKPKELGMFLQKHEDWWSQVGLGSRRSWLEADYASASSCVKRLEEKTRKCPACNAGGKVWVTRSNLPVLALCPRCHGVKDDVGVQYW